MATRHININNYCECLYSELSNIKDSLDAFLTQINLMEGKDKRHFLSHANILMSLSKMLTGRWRYLPRNALLTGANSVKTWKAAHLFLLQNL